MATAPRLSVQKCAPALPKLLRAKTGKGMPYLEADVVSTQQRGREVESAVAVVGFKTCVPWMLKTANQKQIGISTQLDIYLMLLTMESPHCFPYIWSSCVVHSPLEHALVFIV